ncbi:zinc finger protein castor homolog 1 [Drosophila eugracilis]|uniref:zinc finger protein castor homolog 1 n=1 Tax=Drosophila eugracilis TaxID=29029 RepID=UPI0007E7F3CE|nr:zinc finger protein castor homolog 1 [Drosophila eugracilis]XP_017081267.1 zinc finger protein castor homolog 1 [Drosophila eugracilis]
MESSSSSSVVAEMESSNPNDHGQTTQITSIDGFFNRKRGRPPKNRFVEVYKSAQQSPQAIFTSFKLERSDHSGHGGAPATSGSTVDIVEDRLSVADCDGSATDLTPSRNRKRGRVWAPSSSLTLSPLDQSSGRSFNQVAHLTERSETLSRSSQIEFIAKPTEQPSEPLDAITSKNLTSRPLDKVSVVRAAGTFYPENANSSAHQEVTEPGGSTYSSRQETADLEVDQPEDLSMRTSLSEQPAAAAAVGPALNMNLLQFKQLIDLYQRQVLLPSFLAAASQPMALPGSAAGAVSGPLLDMRLLLENAAHQKLLLLNAAASATANAVATPTIDSSQRSTVKRIRDHDIPSGYLKFRFNEDCGFERCGYRNHQSHFHCNRRDCHYSFCDKTRFVQHTARHERMDTLMGDDFRQFRANMQCGVASCAYAASAGGATESTPPNRIDPTESSMAASRKTSHFHCRKCDYVCTDSNKVVAHRRLHLRQDYVRSAGFRKVAGNEPCDSRGCSYAQRHTHYHCVTCDGGVLSRAQLAAHKHRTPFPKQDTETNP